MVAINNNVLAKISGSCETMGMGRRWLIDGPVVEGRVVHWVGSLSKLLGILLGDGDLVGANSHVDSHGGITHCVFGNIRVYEDWDTGLILLDQFLFGCLLLSNGDFIGSNEHFEAEGGFSHGVLHHDWLDTDWNSLLLGQLGGDGGWAVSEEGLESTLGDIAVHQREDGIFITLGLGLSQLGRDWGWPISDQCLQRTLGDGARRCYGSRLPQSR